VTPLRFSPRDRRRGSAALGALALLLVLVTLLGLNYVRNYKIDKSQEQQKRPYAKYKTADLELLAEGYRMELRRAEGRQGAGRVQVRERHHLSDQVREFERVQKEARRVRDRTLDTAQVKGDLEAIEAEQRRRANAQEGVTLHLTRLFRI